MTIRIINPLRRCSFINLALALAIMALYAKRNSRGNSYQRWA
jgi:hypothetical protein